jgi:hypothetical protein
MLIMKLALLSCGFYLAIALVAELVVFAIALWKDVAIGYTWWGWAVWSGAVWLVCTSLAFRLVVSGIRAKLAR